jgi:predicted nucleic acid-binding protein
VNAAQYLIDTSALARLLRGDAEQYGWDQAAAAGLIATCPITELEFFCSARSAADRAQGIEDMRLLFGRVPVDDRAYDRAWRVQENLTQRGQHRSAGAVDLVVAATAELQGLTLLHRDRDFERIAAVHRPGTPVVRPGRRQVSQGQGPTALRKPQHSVRQQETGFAGRSVYTRTSSLARHPAETSQVQSPSTQSLRPPLFEVVPTACP